jgi:NAD(P)-dependent dehydrogenase (short-subunit alcohol dehydrogenase family)
MSMDTEVRFDGEVVIVTGGAGGIGRPQATELGRRGARVVINDLGGSPRGGGSDPSMAAAVVDEIVSAGGEAVASTEDVSSALGPRQLVECALDTWGRVDGIVHNAAILRDAHFENVDDADYDDMMNVNLRGTFRTVQAVYRAMKDNGGGRILTGTSASGLAGAFGQVIYAATKMGVVGLTRSIAWEGMRYGIKANAIAPAAFDSRMYAEMNPEGDAALTGRPPDLEGVAGGRRIHGPVHRKPGDPAGVGTGSPQLPGHRRGLLRDGRLLLPVRHQPQRRRFARIGTHRRGRGGALR